jgi:hypothetical protein
VVDFAIQSGSEIHRLSDGVATLDFTGQILSANSPVSFDYWGGVTINWMVGNNNYVIGLDGGDGFAPATPMPEPTAAITFAAGLLVAGVQIRRRR